MCVFVHEHSKGGVHAGWLIIIIIDDGVVITGRISWTSNTSLGHFVLSLLSALPWFSWWGDWGLGWGKSEKL